MFGSINGIVFHLLSSCDPFTLVQGLISEFVCVCVSSVSLVNKMFGLNVPPAFWHFPVIEIS